MFGQLFKRPPAIQPEEIAALAPPDASAQWEYSWSAAADDAARAACARSAPSHEQALRALLAISDEALLRELERDYRDKDRRLHSAAKQGLQRASKTRQTRAAVAELLAAASALEAAPRFAANQLAELKQAWSKLDLELLDPSPRDAFAALTERLTARLQDFAARHRERGAWLAAAESLAVRIAGLAPAWREQPGALDPLRETAQACQTQTQALLGSPPRADDGGREARAVESCLSALQGDAQMLASLLAKLDLLLSAQTNAETPSAEVQTQWQALPPLPAAELDAALNRRWQALSTPPAATAPPEPARPQTKPAPRISIAPRLQTLEIALAEGHLERAGQQIAQLLAESESARWPEADMARLRALQAETLRLRKWRDWSSAQAREALVTEAETLARSVAAASAGGDAMPVHQLETYIAKLREQWKTLNAGGGALKPAWWERFDGALTAAYAPVQAHKAAQRELRRDNRAAREKLLGEFEGHAFDPAAPDWKAAAQAVQRFKAAWRELGPLEHTVDRGAREPLRKRWEAALTRLEAPLRAANAAATAERRGLIERAAALAAAPGADAAARARALQDEWQTLSRRHPLPQAAERALWQAFRAELDALHARQAEAAKQRQGAQDAARSSRQALIDQLRACDAQTDDNELRKALAAADAAWRAAPALERGRGADLERAFDAAKTQVKRLIGSRRQREWQAALDALAQSLAAATAPSEALTPLPAAWRQALGDRPAEAAAIEDHETLLRLEMALDLPSPVDQTDARRRLKFAELKRTLENRGQPDAAGRSVVAWIADLLRQAPLTPGVEERLRRILAALREREPLR